MFLAELHPDTNVVQWYVSAKRTVPNLVKNLVFLTEDNFDTRPMMYDFMLHPKRYKVTDIGKVEKIK